MSVFLALETRMEKKKYKKPKSKTRYKKDDGI